MPAATGNAPRPPASKRCSAWWSTRASPCPAASDTAWPSRSFAVALLRETPCRFCRCELSQTPCAVEATLQAVSRHDECRVRTVVDSHDSAGSTSCRERFFALAALLVASDAARFASRRPSSKQCSGCCSRLFPPSETLLELLQCESMTPRPSPPLATLRVAPTAVRIAPRWVPLKRCGGSG